MFYHESWQNDICSFRAITVALTVTFKLISFNIYMYIALVLWNVYTLGVVGVGHRCRTLASAGKVSAAKATDPKLDNL